MSRSSDALSRMEILVLSTLARRPMHGYELKLELRYKHVRWWAKCEHGHVYATLDRLARRKHIKLVPQQGDGSRRVYAVTPAGLERVRTGMAEVCLAPDQTHFDVDLFLSGVFLLEQEVAVAMLVDRGDALRVQLGEARALREGMGANVPAVAKLIMDHRVAHLEHEIEFARLCARTLKRQKTWGPFLGRESIGDFVRRTGARLEESSRA
jgi:DNA-binding PadR family transcriptional regulator